MSEEKNLDMVLEVRNNILCNNILCNNICDRVCENQPSSRTKIA